MADASDQAAGRGQAGSRAIVTQAAIATNQRQRIVLVVAALATSALLVEGGLHVTGIDYEVSHGAMLAVQMSVVGINLWLLSMLLRLSRNLERQQAENRLLVEQQAHNLLGRAVSSMPEGFMLWDPDDRLVVINPAMEVLFHGIEAYAEPGMSFEEVVREGLRRGLYQVAPGEEEAWVALRQQMHRNPGMPLELRTPSGGWLLVNERRTPDGYTCALYTDITQLKRAQEDMREAKEQAELASRTKGEFLANMSHELRTPLNAIIGFSEVMMTEVFGPLGSSQYQAYCRNINDSGKHLLDVINDILDVSRLESGRMPLHEERIGPGLLVENTVRMVRERAIAGGLRLDLQMAQELPELLGDSRRIKQMLLNLLSNAIKFTPAGGRIAVRCGTAEDGRLYLEVADTGVGMAAEDIPKAMGMFGQVDSRLERKHEGTGLGLPLVRSLIELHGGSMELHSTPGEGTTVRVWFPRDRLLGENLPMEARQQPAMWI